MAGSLPVAWVHAGHDVGGAGLAGPLAVAVQQGNEALGGMPRRRVEERPGRYRRRDGRALASAPFTAADRDDSAVTVLVCPTAITPRQGLCEGITYRVGDIAWNICAYLSGYASIP